ncbi:hypothetical protein DPMN_040831 [Dreissena polymorpha]|uniref:Uncharacterized protein n=1 Tax=Dreissena polymorpha TaxID=45954 RepID=A0A9D4CYB1_DREPO|nr:hypothetical protein DPMN_040831 [Dreissena polymorpha]
MTTVGSCHFKDKPKVLTTTRVMPGQGDFEVSELPRMPWPQPKGEAHEIHPQSKDQPGIVVHICEDPEGYRSPGKPCIQQTKCPERNT